MKKGRESNDMTQMTQLTYKFQESVYSVSFFLQVLMFSPFVFCLDSDVTYFLPYYNKEWELLLDIAIEF